MNQGIKSEFVLRLSEDYKKPTINIDEMVVLIDTGADVPTFMLTEKQLKDVYNAKLFKSVDDKGEPLKIGGFGGKCTGKIYELEMFKLGELIFPNMRVFVPDNGIKGIDIVISASMFDGLMYDIDTINHTLTVHVPEKEQLIRRVKLEDKDGNIIVLLNGKRVDDNAVLGFNSATNFTQINSTLNNSQERQMQIEASSQEQDLHIKRGGMTI